MVKPVIAPILACLLLLAGCGGGDPQAGDASDQPSASVTTESTSPTPTPAPSPSPTVVPMTVSLGTTCSLLFNARPKPMQQLLDLAPKGSMGTKELRLARSLEDSFATIGETAVPKLQPYIEAMRQTAQEIIDAFADGGGTVKRDLQMFRAAGLELVQRCSLYIE